MSRQIIRFRCWLLGHDFRVFGCDNFGHYGCRRCRRRCACGKFKA